MVGGAAGPVPVRCVWLPAVGTAGSRSQALGARRPPARVSFPDGFPVFSCGARCGAARGGCAGRGAGLQRCGGPAGGRSCGPRCPSPRGGVGAAAARQWGAQIAACRKLRHPVLPRRAGRWRDLLLSPCRPGMAGTEAGSWSSASSLEQSGSERMQTAPTSELQDSRMCLALTRG